MTSAPWFPGSSGEDTPEETLAALRRTDRMIGIDVKPEKYPVRRKVLLKRWHDEMQAKGEGPQVDVFA